MKDAGNSPSKFNLNTISKELYNDLVHYFKYASSAYSFVCLRPNGNTLVLPFSNPLNDIQGYVARDNHRKEIIVALRGSVSIANILADAQVVLVPFVCPGVKLPPGARIHSGFFLSWVSVTVQVLSIVRSQVACHPDYSIVTMGHSLGGSLALLAAITLRQTFPESKIRTYSYGAPRTGNRIFSEYVNQTFGKDAFRVVHGNDGVPTMISTKLGYYHHGIEYWQHSSPPSEATTVECNVDGEDPACSASIPSHGLNLAHATYFGISATKPFCV